MKTFAAILTKTIKFLDVLNRPRTVKKGTEIKVSMSTCQLVSITLTGKKVIEPVGSFVGTYRKNSFDLDRHEFQLLN
jgi:hypothetical protein